MLELYFNDANLLPENREEEQYAEAVLNDILAGKTANTEMCILPCFYQFCPLCGAWQYLLIKDQRGRPLYFNTEADDHIDFFTR